LDEKDYAAHELRSELTGAASTCCLAWPVQCKLQLYAMQGWDGVML
jgi:hypothetical protein